MSDDQKETLVEKIEEDIREVRCNWHRVRVYLWAIFWFSPYGVSAGAFNSASIRSVT